MYVYLYGSEAYKMACLCPEEAGHNHMTILISGFSEVVSCIKHCSRWGNLCWSAVLAACFYLHSHVLWKAQSLHSVGPLSPKALLILLLGYGVQEHLNKKTPIITTPILTSISWSIEMVPAYTARNRHIQYTSVGTCMQWFHMMYMCVSSSGLCPYKIYIACLICICQCIFACLHLHCIFMTCMP